MVFLQPQMLWGLALLALPIIIHLFNFRRFKRVAFTNVRFLQEVKEQTRQQNQLKHLLVLALRLLAIAALVLAFARPVIPRLNSVATPNGDKRVSVYLDNSLSLGARSESGRVFDLARQKAREIIQAQPRSASFQILQNRMGPQSARWLSFKEALDAVENLQLVPEQATLKSINEVQLNLARQSPLGNWQGYVISDFQASLLSGDPPAPDTAYPLTWVPVEGVATGNLYLDSLWFESPLRRGGATEAIGFRVINAGDDSREEVPVSLHLNGRQVALGSFPVQAGGTLDTTLTFSQPDSGLVYGELRIADGQRAFDDTLFFGYQLSAQVNVLCISDSPEQERWVRALFGNDDRFELTLASTNNVNYALLERTNLLIVNELQEISSGLTTELDKFYRAGGTLFVVPGDRIEAASYGALFGLLGTAAPGEVIERETATARLESGHPLFEGAFNRIPNNLDLPKINRYYRLRTPATGTAILQLASGNPLLFEVSNGGMCMVSAVPLSADWSNAARHAVFITAILRLSEISASGRVLFPSTASNQPLTINNLSTSAEDVPVLVNLKNGAELIPEKRSEAGSTLLYTYGQVRQAGHYDVRLNGKPVAATGFNWSRAESTSDFLSQQQLLDYIATNNLTSTTVLEPSSQNLTALVREREQGLPLWKWFILASVLALLAEALVLRFWR